MRLFNASRPLSSFAWTNNPVLGGSLAFVSRPRDRVRMPISRETFVSRRRARHPFALRPIPLTRQMHARTLTFRRRPPSKISPTSSRIRWVTFLRGRCAGSGGSALAKPAAAGAVLFVRQHADERARSAWSSPRWRSPRRGNSVRKWRGRADHLEPRNEPARACRQFSKLAPSLVERAA